jgi:hypothetical protein
LELHSKTIASACLSGVVGWYPQKDIKLPLTRTNMEKLIQLIQALHSEMSALAWLALGFLLPVCIIMCFVAVFWIRRGGMAARSTSEFFVEEREIACWLREPDL